MSGQDVNVAAFKLLANQLQSRFIQGVADSGGQLVLQLGELSDLPAEGVRRDPLLADLAPVHHRGHAITGLLGVGEAAREPTARLPQF